MKKKEKTTKHAEHTRKLQLRLEDLLQIRAQLEQETGPNPALQKALDQIKSCKINWGE